MELKQIARNKYQSGNLTVEIHLWGRYYYLSDFSEVAEKDVDPAVVEAAKKIFYDWGF